MDSKPNWPNRQLADGYNFVDAASTGFDGAVLMIPSSLTGFNQTAFGYVRDPNGGTTMCFGGILTSCGNAPCCPECGRRMHINDTVTGEIKHYSLKHKHNSFFFGIIKHLEKLFPSQQHSTLLPSYSSPDIRLLPSRYPSTSHTGPSRSGAHLPCLPAGTCISSAVF